MGRRAIWLEIEATLREEIANGHYRPGDKLPTEAEQARRFGVNRHTVRRALAALQEAGLVRARRGAGVFVTAEPTTYHLSRRTRFHANLAAMGHVAEHRTLRLDTRLCDAREAELLGLQPGEEVHVREGVGLSDGIPLTLYTSLFPGRALPGFTDLLHELASVTKALNAAGIADYTRAWTRISAERATATQSGHLQCPDGAALLRTTSLNIDSSGRPVEYGVTYFVGERIELVVEPS